MFKTANVKALMKHVWAESILCYVSGQLVSQTDFYSHKNITDMNVMKFPSLSVKMHHIYIYPQPNGKVLYPL